MITTALITSAIEEYTSETSMFLVQVSIGSGNSIHVTMDGDEGITIAECVSLSKFLEHRLDRDAEDFSLEVSSYGVGNPLLLPRQYIRNKGRKLQIMTQGDATLEGRIMEADEEGVELELNPSGKKGSEKVATVRQRFSYDELKQAIVQVEF